MEKQYQEFKSGLKLRVQDLDWSQLKMLKSGVLIEDHGKAVINPICRKSTSYSYAKERIKNIVDSWLENMAREKESQMKFRSEMVEYFKNNPMGDIYTRSGVMYSDLPIDCLEAYKNTKGYVYLFNGNVITLHAGYDAPDNLSDGLDRFKYETSLGSIIINV